MKTCDCKHYCVRPLFILAMNLLLISLSCSDLYAARIDGPANIRENPKGKAILLLNDGVYVDCDCEELNTDWFLIGITIKLEPDRDSFYIKKNQLLYDLDGQEIGKALTPLRIEQHYEKKDGKHIGDIVAYTHKDNIRKNSFLLNALTDILAHKNTGLTFLNLTDHLKEFRYQPWIDTNKFKTFTYSDPWMVTETPSLRVSLIFHREKLVAVIHHYQRIQLVSKITKQLLLGYKISYVEVLDKKTSDELEDFYRGVLLTAN